MVEVMSLCRYIVPVRSIRVGTVKRIVCGFQWSLIMRAFSVATMCIPTCYLVACRRTATISLSHSNTVCKQCMKEGGVLG